MAEQIGVTYLPVVGGAYHMALFYDNGDGQKQVIEVAPQHNLDELSASAVFGELIKEAFLPGNTNDGSPFGFIVGELGLGTLKATTCAQERLLPLVIT
jgi:hypothetical protein